MRLILLSAHAGSTDLIIKGELTNHNKCTTIQGTNEFKCDKNTATKTNQSVFASKKTRTSSLNSVESKKVVNSTLYVY